MSRRTLRRLLAAPLAALVLSACAAQRPQRPGEDAAAVAAALVPGQRITYLDEARTRRWLEVEAVQLPVVRGSGWVIDSRGHRSGLQPIELDLRTVHDLAVVTADAEAREAAEILGGMAKVAVLVIAGLLLAL